MVASSPTSLHSSSTSCSASACRAHAVYTWYRVLYAAHMHVHVHVHMRMLRMCICMCMSTYSSIRAATCKRMKCASTHKAHWITCVYHRAHAACVHRACKHMQYMCASACCGSMQPASGGDTASLGSAHAALASALEKGGCRKPEGVALKPSIGQSVMAQVSAESAFQHAWGIQGEVGRRLSREALRGGKLWRGHGASLGFWVAEALPKRTLNSPPSRKLSSPRASAVSNQLVHRRAAHARWQPHAATQDLERRPRLLLLLRRRGRRCRGVRRGVPAL